MILQKGIVRVNMNLGIKIYRRIQTWTRKIAVRAKEQEIKENCNVTVGKQVRFFPETNITTVEAGKIFIGNQSVIRGDICCLRGEGRVTIGSECYIGEATHIWSTQEIKIGNRVLIAHNCGIYDDTTHPIDSVERNDDFINICFKGMWKKYDTCESKPIIIENNAWIGSNVVILKGVTIGEGAIVGAGSVVTKDVPPYTMVAGNPAKLVRKIEKSRDNGNE